MQSMADATQTPRTRPPAFVKPFRYLLYLLLLGSAVATIAGVPTLEEAVREGRRPPAFIMIGPALLAVFVVLFAVYRFALVRAGRYHAGKAFVQVGFMLAVLALLLPGSVERYRAAGAGRARPVDLTRQLGSPDPEARAMAAELVRHRDPPDAMRYVPRLLALLDDPAPEVRRQARSSLVVLAGEDAGGEGVDAPARWRAFWGARGVAAP